MHRASLVALLAAAALAAGISQAAEVSFVTKSTLLVRGEISAGDYERAVIAIAKNFDEGGDFMSARRVVVHSRGGDLQEAQRLAELVYDLYATVVVVDECQSACFWILAAAARRTILPVDSAKPPPTIGIHNVYLSTATAFSLGAGDYADRIKQINMEAARSLQRFEVPQAIIDTLVRRTSGDIHNLTPQERLDLGQYRPSVNQARAEKCAANTKAEREVSAALLGLPFDRNITVPSEDYWRTANACFLELFRRDAIISMMKHLEPFTSSGSRRR